MLVAVAVLAHMDDLSSMLSLHTATTLENQWKLGRVPFGKTSEFPLAADQVFVSTDVLWNTGTVLVVLHTLYVEKG